MSTSTPTPPTLAIDFAGELTVLSPDETFTIGRQGDLALDDNPYLHRDFLHLCFHDSLWWVHNRGSRLAAGLTDESGLMRSTLAPGARMPLVFPRTTLTFAAGSTSYEVLLECPVEGYRPTPTTPGPSHASESGDTTIAPTTFTESQLLAILALAEPVLRRVGTGASSIPTSVEAARRLGWTQTRFNRKLDNVCDKLTSAGVSGLRGGAASAAANRRLRLVEYAVQTLLVTADHLPLIEAEAHQEVSR